VFSPASQPDGFRQVQRLRLRVGHEDAANRARIAIEDGLATADFADHGRLVFIRRLRLPAFAEDFNGPAAARAIEATFRAQLPSAVHATDAGAAEAPIVWFEDALEAFVEALALRAEGRPLTAWFWPQVDAEIFATPAPEVAVVFAALLRPSDPAVEARVLPVLAQRWRSFSPSAFARFIAALPEPATEHKPTLIYRPESAPPAGAQWTEARARIAAAAAVSAKKAAWVARWELVAAGLLPADATPLERAPLVAAAVESSVSVHAAHAPDIRAPESPAPLAPATRSELRVRRNPRVPESPSRPQALRNYLHQIAALEPVSSMTAASDESELFQALPPWLAGARASAHAGFFLLVNAWHCAGWTQWLEEQPRDLVPSIAAAWLERWSRRLALPEDDVQRQAWQPQNEALPPEIAAELEVWMKRTRRWLRTGARIGPASLVVREGLACVTRTHIDVAFPLDAVDLRVRRCGLDANPGWVAWLGRIINFHFIEELHGNRAR
jgi:hypothetical protein